MNDQALVRQKKFLNQAEFQSFESRRKAIIRGAIICFFSVGILAINNKLLHFEIRGLALVAIIVSFLASGLWTMIQMFQFKCPRCKATPMAKRMSLDGGTIESASFVALCPDKCGKCGVHFSIAGGDAA